MAKNGGKSRTFATPPNGNDGAQKLSIAPACELDDAKTEGQRLLRAVPGSLADIASRIGCGSRQSVAAWKNGSYVPDDKYRQLLAIHFGIPYTSWSPIGTDDTEEDDGSASAQGDYEELLRGLRRQLRRGGLTPKEQLQFTEAIESIAWKKDRTDRDRELQEDRIIREHEKWKVLKAAIIRALVAHPAAARDVEAVLTQMLAEEQAEMNDEY
jgi:transcriptional regulator with XRE-family HTH domain